MPFLERDEYFNRIRDIIGTNQSEEATVFLEDMTDTSNELENRANNSGGEWERKYHELDESWKTRYRHRFFSGGNTATFEDRESEEESEQYDPDNVTIEALFESKTDK